MKGIHSYVCVVFYRLATSDVALVEIDKYSFVQVEELVISGSSTPVLDEIPPVSVSVQDIFDRIVLEASQLNQLLSVGEEIDMEDVESGSEESPDVSENERFH